MFGSMLTAVALAVLTPMAVAASAGWVEKIKQKASNARLTAAPLVYEGAKYDSVVSEASGAELIGKCTVTSLEVGRVEVTDANGRKMSWTGQEFETLHPLYSAKQ